MPGTNDFLPFAVGGGANVVTQAAYAALTSLLANGFSAGTANSNELNKVWRQSTIMSAVLAQFIVDETGANAVDDGTTATLLANLKLAIQPAISRAAHAGGTADAITATFTNPPTTFVDGLPYYVRAASANATTTPTFTPNSGTLAAHTIVKGNGAALAAGDIAGAGHWLELQYDTTLTAWVLLNPATGIGTVTAASDPTFANNSGSAASTSWVRGAMSAIAAAAGFSINLGSSGYIALPSWLGGLILQWGQFTWVRTTAGTMTVNFPIAFPNSVLQVALTDSGTAVGATGAQSWRTDLTTNSLFGAYSSAANPSSEVGVAQFFAIGY